MPEIDEFQPGLPSWADLSSPDLDESASFYGELLGWEARDQGEDYGGYRTFAKDDKVVAGLAPTQNEDQPPSWNVYIAVADADETAEKVDEAGGEVVAKPMDVGELGRMAFFADPGGAQFGVWQAKEHKGADVVSEPGAPAWHQVNTRDPEKAEEFYSAVFGWETEKVDTGGADYWEWQLDGKSVGACFGWATTSLTTCRPTGSCTSRSTTPTPPRKRRRRAARRCEPSRSTTRRAASRCSPIPTEPRSR